MTGKEYADKEYKDLNEGMKGIIAKAFEAGLKQHEHDYLVKTKKIRNEYQAQIEKMKNCKNCANYMISGKCPSFFRTGWCINQAGTETAYRPDRGFQGFGSIGILAWCEIPTFTDKE